MKLGFSFKGFVVFMLPMLINIVYFMFPPVNSGSTPVQVNKFFDMIEQVTRAAYGIVICIIVSKQKSSVKSPFLWIGVVFLVLYYIVWIRYFMGGRDVALLGSYFLGIPMPLAVFPVLYFIFESIWLHNYYALGLMIAFGIAHNVTSYQSLYCK